MEERTTGGAVGLIYTIKLLKIYDHTEKPGQSACSFLRYLMFCIIYTIYGNIKGQGHSYTTGHDLNFNWHLPLTHIYAYVQFERNLSNSFWVTFLTLFISGSDAWKTASKQKTDTRWSYQSSLWAGAISDLCWYWISAESLHSLLRYLLFCMIFTKYGSIEGEDHSHF